MSCFPTSRTTISVHDNGNLSESEKNSDLLHIFAMNMKRNQMINALFAVALAVLLPFLKTDGKDRFVNPVIPQDYSDPDVCRVGSDYWMTASSFAGCPGLPILHSTDLVHWELVNYALPSLASVGRPCLPGHGDGVWAPSIRFHEGEYYIYWGDPDYGIYMVKATEPDGHWSAPSLVKPGKGLIDPCPLWDENGRCYLVHGWAKSRCGFNSVLCISELNPDGTGAIGSDVLVYDGNTDGNHTVEGPKLYKREGWYWIFAPAGGVEKGWQLAMRSQDIYGPYEARIVMKEGKSGINGPHQGAWVSTSGGAGNNGADGSGVQDWFLNFRDTGPFGRVDYLNPMRWSKDGWPVIGTDGDGDGCGDPVADCGTPDLPEFNASLETSDEFNSPETGLQWQWSLDCGSQQYGFPSSEGFFRLLSFNAAPGSNLWTVPGILLQKVSAVGCIATAKVSFDSIIKGERCGLTVFGLDYSALCIENMGDRFEISLVTCKKADKGGPEVRVALSKAGAKELGKGIFSRNVCGPVWLRVEIGADASVKYSFSIDGVKFKDAGVKAEAKEGKWVGARIGFFCENFTEAGKGWMDIDYIRFE
jgi:Beta-xylosidase